MPMNTILLMNFVFAFRNSKI